MQTTGVTELQHTLLRKVGKAIGDFSLIAEGDRIMLALSGGKDSWTLLHVLQLLQKKAPVHFELHIFSIDQGFPGFDAQRITDYLRDKMHIKSCSLHQAAFNDILRLHADPEKSICALCSRLRRGILYRLAREQGMTKIALAHHADDFIETLLLNLFFNGRIKAMSPLLRSDDGSNTIIRPLCYVDEECIDQFAQAYGFPIIDIDCPASSARQLQRAMVKKLIAQLESQHPGIKASMLSALGRIDDRHLFNKAYLPTGSRAMQPSRATVLKEKAP